MTDWEKHWAVHPKTVGRTDYLKQVGKTVHGQPISECQYQVIVSDICSRLALEKDDIVLDLCCGNGLITQELAKRCNEVVGVDFSLPLLEVANQDHRPANVRYQHLNVLHLDNASPVASGPYNKVVMYEALQFFKREDLSTILRNILRFSAEKRVILFASIPDRRKRWQFYNTPTRRLAYLIRKLSGNGAIGTWWDREFIQKACNQLNLQCEFHEQSRELHTAHYRFDAVII